MRFYKICLVVLVALTMSSCSIEASDDLSSGNNQPLDNNSLSSNQEKHAHQALTGAIVPQQYLWANEGMTVSLLDIGLEKLLVRKKSEGYPDALSEYQLSAYILSDYRYSEPARHDSYLAVETMEGVLVYDLGDSSLDDFLYLCDVDDDGVDEVIVQQTIDMSGGAGQHLSRIFRIVEGEIREIFSSYVPDPSGTGEKVFDTGFISEFLNGYKLRIDNTFTGYSTVVDISKRYTNEFFDENGKGRSTIGIWCDSFWGFIPEDVDGDGIFEIACQQYVSLTTHADGIGTAKSILKFNPQTQEFEVVQAEFVTGK